MKSIFYYHQKAYTLILSRLFPTYFIYLFILILTVMALAIPVLLPLVSIASILYLMRFAQQKKSDLKGTLSALDITIDQYLVLMITLFVKRIIILAGYILFIVPGMIFSHALAPVGFLFANNKNYKTSEAIHTSLDGMKGYKFKLFLLTIVGRLPLMIWLLLIFAMMVNDIIQVGAPLLLLFIVSLPLFIFEQGFARLFYFQDVYRELDFEATSEDQTQKSNRKEWLYKLDEMLQNGLIEQSEYDAEKKRLLNDKASGI